MELLSVLIAVTNIPQTETATLRQHPRVLVAASGNATAPSARKYVVRKEMHPVLSRRGEGRANFQPVLHPFSHARWYGVSMT